MGYGKGGGGAKSALKKNGGGDRQAMAGSHGKRPSKAKAKPGSKGIKKRG